MTLKTHEFECDEGDCIVCETDEGTVAIAILEVHKSRNYVWLEIDSPKDVTIQVDGTPRELWGTPVCTGLPRLWLMFSLVLSGKIKREIFMPSFNEFIEDYIYAQKMYQGKWERRWARIAFTCRSLRMVCACFRLQVWGTLAILGRLAWKKFFGE